MTWIKRMGSRCIRASLLAALVVTGGVASVLAAQIITRPAPTAAAGNGLILGRVVDAGSGQGVAGALVTLTPSGPSAAPLGELTESRPLGPPSILSAGSSLRVLTADDGRFVFRDLPAAQFSLVATTPAYTTGAYGRVRPNGPARTLTLTEGQKLGDAVIRVWKSGSISGTVTDELGEPAVAVGVRCLRRVIAGGQGRFSTTGLDTLITTDDRGTYRVPNLPPGDYICGFMSNHTTVPMAAYEMSQTALQGGNPNSSESYRNLANSGGTFIGASGIRLGDLVLSPLNVSTTRGLPPPPASGGRLLVYGTTFHPTGATTRQATVISLSPGEDRAGINIQLRPVPAVRISGRVTGPDGPGAFLNIALFPVSGVDLVSDSAAEAGGTISDASGAFTFLGIAAGQYVARIKLYPRPAPGSPGGPAAGLDLTSLWATVPVAADADVEGLNISLRAGIRVTGQVVFEGAKPPSPADVQRLALRLQSADGRTSSPISLDGRVAPDLTFRTAGYAGGRYIVSVLASSMPAGWSLKSAKHEGRDLSVEPVELAEGDIPGVVLTLTDKTTTVSGRVTGSAAEIDGAEIVAWPSDSSAWRSIGVVARRWRHERVDRSGGFALTGLPAGDYFVAAIGATFAGDPQDPRVLESLTKVASRVTVPEGGTSLVTLTVRTR
jgi:hypothetical protein